MLDTPEIDFRKTPSRLFAVPDKLDRKLKNDYAFKIQLEQNYISDVNYLEV